MISEKEYKQAIKFIHAFHPEPASVRSSPRKSVISIERMAAGVRVQYSYPAEFLPPEPITFSDDDLQHLAQRWVQSKHVQQQREAQHKEDAAFREMVQSVDGLLKNYLDTGPSGSTGRATFRKQFISLAPDLQEVVLRAQYSGASADALVLGLRKAHKTDLADCCQDMLDRINHELESQFNGDVIKAKNYLEETVLGFTYDKLPAEIQLYFQTVSQHGNGNGQPLSYEIGKLRFEVDHLSGHWQVLKRARPLLPNNDVADGNEFMMREMIDETAPIVTVRHRISATDILTAAIEAKRHLNTLEFSNGEKSESLRAVFEARTSAACVKSAAKC